MPPKGSKKAKKSGSNIFALFSQKQIQEFKEAEDGWVGDPSLGFVTCDPSAGSLGGWRIMEDSWTIVQDSGRWEEEEEEGW